MPLSAPTPSPDVKKRIVEYLERVPFERAIENADFRELLEEDKHTDKPLYRQEAIDAIEEARKLRHLKRNMPTASAFFSNKNVLIVPGFLGSQLRDEMPLLNGLIWINPSVYWTPDVLSNLRLGKFQAGIPDADAKSAVKIREDSALPIVYSALRYYLESGRCEARIAGFDWRKNLDESALLLVDTIRAFANEHPERPFFLIAHSQGSLVARRALQLLGKDEARRLVNRLILLGPASYGTFSAAFAIAGNHSTIEALARLGLHWPDDMNAVLQSMSGLYQLLPWKEGTVGMPTDQLGQASFWETGCDAKRLNEYFKWGASLDTEFFHDRTTIILGDDPDTTDAVAFDNGVLISTHETQGDGTVPDQCAIVEGVTDLSRATGASHMRLPLNREVMQTVWRIINANIHVQALSGLAVAPNAARRKGNGTNIMPLPAAIDLLELAGVPAAAPAPSLRRGAAPKAAVPAPPLSSRQPPIYNNAPPAPPTRRLKVFSFDPMLAADPDSMGVAEIVLELDWDDESADGAKLQPGPVGEYLEVIDYDPASGCFYAPVQLNHPNLLAQDGMPLSETDPRFHQQMVYAVSMTTIKLFERALGRTVLWSPHINRNASGKVVHDGDSEFVRRLRIYPHAMRQANAFYDPSRKALLFGYFPSMAKPGGKVLPRGTVFTCLSYDVIAHETTHALLDGLHRYFLDATNPDMLAFHEAFADIVALFQHFSHASVLRDQVAKAAGRLEGESILGQLAQQFGEAMGIHGSLRSYLGQKDDQGIWMPKTPDPKLIATIKEPHDRGAILVAAMFTAFLTIYRNRTRDLFRIAAEGSAAQGSLHPDLVARLADEAAKAARHLLLMAIRALDYLPPVDVTFGDYLRGLITSDVDLIPGDARFYRLAMVDAFRQWGIYPAFVTTLSVDALVWHPPESASLKLDLELFREIAGVSAGNLQLDRGAIYEHQRNYQRKIHEWMRGRFADDPELAAEWGLAVAANAPQTIERERRANGTGASLPKFEVHSVRRCRRIAPDGRERIDVLLEVTQKRNGYLDPAVQNAADKGNAAVLKGEPDFHFRGGATLIIDPQAGRIRYAIRQSILNDSRLEATRDFVANHGSALGLAGNYFRGAVANPFPFLHATEE